MISISSTTLHYISIPAIPVLWFWIYRTVSKIDNVAPTLTKNVVSIWLSQESTYGLSVSATEFISKIFDFSFGDLFLSGMFIIGCLRWTILSILLSVFIVILHYGIHGKYFLEFFSGTDVLESSRPDWKDKIAFSRVLSIPIVVTCSTVADAISIIIIRTAFSYVEKSRTQIFALLIVIDLALKFAILYLIELYSLAMMFIYIMNPTDLVRWSWKFFTLPTNVWFSGYSSIDFLEAQVSRYGLYAIAASSVLIEAWLLAYLIASLLVKYHEKINQIIKIGNFIIDTSRYPFKALAFYLASIITAFYSIFLLLSFTLL